MNYWLFKSEPDEFSFEDLVATAQSGEPWTGIRNYQARNILRDQVSVGDRVFFYHSSCTAVGIVGIAEIISEPYLDPTQFDTQGNVIGRAGQWVCVDIKAIESLPRRVSLKEIKATPALSDMVLVKSGRLSVQPVTREEWQFILKLAQ